MVFYFDVACPPDGGKWIVYMVCGRGREREGGYGRACCVDTHAHTTPLHPHQGRDRYENEDLIKYGFPDTDIWFHVDDLSSAHVYLRPPPGGSIDAIPPSVLSDACQLTKANSIMGSKAASVAIVYTPHGNLLKRDGYDVGTVGFKDESAVRRVPNVRKDADAVKRLEKTRREVAKPDLAGELEAHEKKVAAARRAVLTKAKADEKAARAASVAAKEAKSYDRLLESDAMTTPAELAGKYESAAAFEDDFM